MMIKKQQLLANTQILLNRMQNVLPAPKTIQELQKTWNKFASTYQMHDSAMQTFFYSLIHMIDLPQAKHVLEVACGTGRLLPLAMNLKGEECTYLASDISEAMIGLCRNNLMRNLEKMGSSYDLEQWMEKVKLSLRAANGEQKIEAPYKFDRIIANLVLHLTEDPIKMMKNFYSMAEEGCLLAVSVTGSEDLVDFNRFKRTSMQEKGDLQMRKTRSSSYLSPRLKELGEASGWVLVQEWTQNTAMVWKEVDEGLIAFLNFLSLGDQHVVDFMRKKVQQKLQAKKALNFQAQVAIFKKK